MLWPHHLMDCSDTALPGILNPAKQSEILPKAVKVLGYFAALLENHLGIDAQEHERQTLSGLADFRGWQGQRRSAVAIETLQGMNVMNVMNVSLTPRVRKAVSEMQGVWKTFTTFTTFSRDDDGKKEWSCFQGFIYSIP